MKVAIVGSRDFSLEENRDSPSWAKHPFIEKVVSMLTPSDYVVSGGAPGADYWGETFARRYNVGRIIHAADWDRHGKAAGPLRNTLIVNDADALFAFYTDKTKSRGTNDSVNKARAKGIPVFEYDAATEDEPWYWKDGMVPVLEDIK